MDLKRIYAVYGAPYDREKLVSEIQQEGYKHYFIANMNMDESKVRERMPMVDEVWLFGDVEDTKEYKIALELGCDIWRMG